MPGDITELFNNINASLAPSSMGSMSFAPAAGSAQAVSEIGVPGTLETQLVGMPNPSPDSNLIDFLGGFNELNAGIQPIGLNGLESMPMITSSPTPQPETKLGSLLKVAAQPFSNTGSLRMIG